MAFLDSQARMYLALQGHLPEMFLLMEIFGRTEEEAKKILDWREQEMTRFDPAVRGLRVVAERRDLRKKLELPPVENEEADFNDDKTTVRTMLTGQATITPNGVEITGDFLNQLSPEQAAQVKEHIISEVKKKVSGLEGPGEVEMPDGQVMRFASPEEFMAFLEGISRKESEDEDGSEGNWPGVD